MEGRRGGYGNWYEELYCGSAPDASRVYLDLLTRLTFTAADGTEYELRDQLTGGQPINLTSVPCGSNGNSRGKVFVTADGSAATFVSDTPISDYKWKPMGLNDQFRPSGYLWLRGPGFRIAFEGNGFKGLIFNVLDGQILNNEALVKKWSIDDYVLVVDPK